MTGKSPSEYNARLASVIFDNNAAGVELFEAILNERPPNLSQAIQKKENGNTVTFSAFIERDSDEKGTGLVKRAVSAALNKAARETGREYLGANQTPPRYV